MEGGMLKETDIRWLDELTRTTRGRFIEFLMERGLDLFHSEPDPDYEEYMLRYLEDPPAHIELADDEWRLARAREAWRAAVEGQLTREADAAAALVDVGFLVARKLIDIVDLKHEPDRAKHPAILARTRRVIIEKWWLEKQWREPWVSLIDQEFPGDGPSVADTDAIEALRPAWEAKKAEEEAQFDQGMKAMHGILERNGYVPGSTDRGILVKLIGNSRIYAKTGFDWLLDQSATLIIEDATDPSSSGWEEVMQVLFPTPKPDD